MLFCTRCRLNPQPAVSWVEFEFLSSPVKLELESILVVGCIESHVPLETADDELALSSNHPAALIELVFSIEDNRLSRTAGDEHCVRFGATE